MYKYQQECIYLILFEVMKKVRYIIQIALLRNTESRALSLISALELLPKFLAKFVSQKC
jgi:hypothetical protein